MNVPRSRVTRPSGVSIAGASPGLSTPPLAPTPGSPRGRRANCSPRPSPRTARTAPAPARRTRRYESASRPSGGGGSSRAEGVQPAGAGDGVYSSRRPGGGPVRRRRRRRRRVLDGGDEEGTPSCLCRGIGRRWSGHAAARRAPDGSELLRAMGQAGRQTRARDRAQGRGGRRRRRPTEATRAGGRDDDDARGRARGRGHAAARGSDEGPGDRADAHPRRRSPSGARGRAGRAELLVGPVEETARRITRALSLARAVCSTSSRRQKCAAARTASSAPLRAAAASGGGAMPPPTAAAAAAAERTAALLKKLRAAVAAKTRVDAGDPSLQPARVEKGRKASVDDALRALKREGLGRGDELVKLALARAPRRATRSWPRRDATLARPRRDVARRPTASTSAARAHRHRRGNDHHHPDDALRRRGDPPARARRQRPRPRHTRSARSRPPRPRQGGRDRRRVGRVRRTPERPSSSTKPPTRSKSPRRSGRSRHPPRPHLKTDADAKRENKTPYPLSYARSPRASRRASASPHDVPARRSPGVLGGGDLRAGLDGRR